MEIFLGVCLSVIVQIIKKYISEPYRIVVVVALSLLAGVAYFFLKQNVELLKSILAIFSYASGFYVLIIKEVEKRLSK